MQHFGRKFITNGLRDISIEEDMGGDMGGVSPGVRIDGGMAVGDAQQQQMQEDMYHHQQMQQQQHYIQM
jgi:membrane protein involved in colicin uptake